MKALSEKHYIEAISIDENDFWSHTNLGSLYEESGKDKEAADMFAKAYKINPSHFMASYNLGVIFRKIGDSE